MNCLNELLVLLQVKYTAIDLVRENQQQRDQRTVLDDDISGR